MIKVRKTRACVHCGEVFPVRNADQKVCARYECQRKSGAAHAHALGIHQRNIPFGLTHDPWEGMDNPNINPFPGPPEEYLCCKEPLVMQKDGSVRPLRQSRS